VRSRIKFKNNIVETKCRNRVRELRIMSQKILQMNSMTKGKPSTVATHQKRSNLRRIMIVSTNHIHIISFV